MLTFPSIYYTDIPFILSSVITPGPRARLLTSHPKSHSFPGRASRFSYTTDRVCYEALIVPLEEISYIVRLSHNIVMLRLPLTLDTDTRHWFA
jgi:hypothetical protein